MTLPNAKATPPDVDQLPQLSAEISFLYKCLPAIPAILFLLSLPIFGSNQATPPPQLISRLIMPLFTAVFTIATGWYVGTIREVWLGPHGFIVGGWIKKIEIPYANIAHVAATRWLNPERITLVLKTPGEFGARIHFLPSPRMFPLFSPHPTYLQLVDLLRRNNGTPEN